MKVLIKKLIREALLEAKSEPTDDMVLVVDRGIILTLFDISNKKVIGNINVWNNEVSGVAAIKGYGPLMYELGMAHVYPNGLQSDRRGNTEPKAENIWNNYIKGMGDNIKVVKLTPDDSDYLSIWQGGGEEGNPMSQRARDSFMNYKFYNPDKTLLNKLIERGNELPEEYKKKIIKLGDEFYSSVAP